MSLPWFTRVWFTAICITTLSGTLGFITFDKFAYYGDFIFSSKLQLWRLVTCFALAGKLNFGFIMLIVMIVQYRFVVVYVAHDGGGGDDDWQHSDIILQGLVNHSMRLMLSPVDLWKSRSNPPLTTLGPSF
jgi:hypothetical protein